MILSLLRDEIYIMSVNVEKYLQWRIMIIYAKQNDIQLNSKI